MLPTARRRRVPLSARLARADHLRPPGGGSDRRTARSRPRLPFVDGLHDALCGSGLGLLADAALRPYCSRPGRGALPADGEGSTLLVRDAGARWTGERKDVYVPEACLLA